MTKLANEAMRLTNKLNNIVFCCSGVPPKTLNIICKNNINDIKTPIDEIFSHKDFVIILTFLLIGF